MDLNDALAVVLDDERAKAKLTYDELVVRTGLARRSLIRYHLGQRPITVETLEILATAYGTRPSTLMKQAEKRKEA